MRPRLLDTATALENHERFLRRSIEHRSVWTLWGDSGPIVADADPLDGATGDPARDVYMFFSDQPYAQRALRESWPNCPTYTTREIPIFDLLYRWLPGLDRDGHRCGTNWTGDLIGLELQPAELLAQLRERLPEALAQDLDARYRELLAPK